MAFNENTRVKIPAILHLYRLGYKYISLKTADWDKSTNIFPEIFRESVGRINPDLESEDIERKLEELKLVLDYEDLGKEFYNQLTATSDIKLLDFENFENNSFNVVTELPCKKDEEEFRPDITLLINGMPLAFVEVKKPNNYEGIIAERNRINDRFKNRKFRKFINITQLIIFSNNMEYDDNDIEPIQGAFYATTSHNEAIFNYFREEKIFNKEKLLSNISNQIEDKVLFDNNLASIKSSPEFETNKSPDSPTNRILTSLFSKERLAFFLKFGLAYVQTSTGLEKHVMRYPQFFASMAIREKLDEDVRKGIIWHTQGSGKTALSYFNVHFLTDYFSKQNVVPKFYFIVDRLDLLKQAKREFSSRGLIVHTVNSRGEFIKSFNEKVAIHNQSGKREITVVNIHKFSDESNIINEADYDINIQRVYFLDEVHRSYDPKGSFLANLVSSDRKAIIIGLTGTPLISDKKKSKDIFGDYIHKYYYNSSIIDGYTLKLIREGIETKYRLLLEQALKDIEILKGNIQKKEVYSHERFVSHLLDYIIDDFTKSRIRFGDKSIGAMVICDSSEQAKKLYELFTDRYPEASNIAASDETELIAAEPATEYVAHSSFPQFKAALILHDIGTKDGRDQLVEDFKEGKIDFLFVFNMLLTGFDAKRLKKLYMGRLIKSHNLLQALTRVNRPYKKFRYGYVVDFADIRKEFEATNKAYFKELQEELGDELETYSNLFKSKEEIQYEIEDFHEKLFYYDLKNAEIFSQQISKIEDRAKVIEVKNALENARNLFNLIKYFGYEEFLEKVDFKKLNQLFNETQRHLALLNLKEKVKNKIDSSELLNTALENVIFMFKKVSEKELVIADQLKDSLKKTREALAGNFDKKDPEFVSLFDELKRLFEGKNLEEISQEEMKSNMAMLGKIFDQATELNRKNDLLRGKYEYDEKYARIHKRLVEHKWLTEKESKVFSFLSKIKKDTDHLLLNNTNLLKNESYFEAEMLSFLFNELDEENYDLEMDEIKLINACITREYFNESQGICQW